MFVRVASDCMAMQHHLIATLSLQLALTYIACSLIVFSGCISFLSWTGMLQGRTVLHMLAHHEFEREPVIKTLDAAGADVSIQDIRVRRRAVHILA
jgi:hypothetical protein